MKNELALVGALIPIISVIVFGMYYVSTLHGTIQAHEEDLYYKAAQIVEVQQRILYLEEALVNVVITSETNEHRLNLMEEIFD